MCTSVTLKTKDEKLLLARTLDFNEQLTETIYVVPRKYPFRYCENGEIKSSKYGFIAMGMKQDENIMFYDGMNEKGLICATLYLETTKVSQKRQDKFNISIGTFTTWILSQFSSIEEIIQNLPSINIICDEKFEGMPCHPLHWIIMDSSSRTIVIEKECRLTVYENELGVLSNEPNFICQKENLKNYCSITPQNESIGLPGDTTSLSRFVRAAYMKQYTELVEGEINGITAAFKILSTTDIQKGIDFDEPDVSSYTHTATCMCSNSLTYYCYTYDNRQIQAFKLLNENLDDTQIKEYPLVQQQNIKYNNK